MNLERTIEYKREDIESLREDMLSAFRDYTEEELKTLREEELYSVEYSEDDINSSCDEQFAYWKNMFTVDNEIKEKCLREVEDVPKEFLLSTLIDYYPGDKSSTEDEIRIRYFQEELRQKLEDIGFFDTYEEEYISRVISANSL